MHVRALACLAALFLALLPGAQAAPLSSVSKETPAEKAALDALLAEMTLEEKICQLFFITPEPICREGSVTSVTYGVENGLARYPVGGIILFPNNMKSERQLTALISGMQKAALKRRGIGLFVGVDEEGGGISRVATKLRLAEKQPAAGEIGRTGEPEQAFQAGAAIGGYLSRYGFNVNFAPVADVRTGLENTEIGSRSFGDAPQAVSEMVTNFVRGVQSQGVLAVLKHFPGHGSAVGNAHEGRSISTRGVGQWREAEWLPFQAGLEAGAGMVMMSHLTAAVVDNRHPASLSPRIVSELLRQELGFDGVVITDALRMDAIAASYGSGEACVLALKAGVDMLLLPKNFSNALEGVRAALDSGELPPARVEESVRRILLLKMRSGLVEGE